MSATTIEIDSLLERCNFPAPNQRAVCAVSGGGDSLAMTLLAREAGCAVEVVHIDHQLRTSSAADAKFVAGVCESLGVSCEVIRVTLEPGPNLEARARAERHAALPNDALLAHTANDQAETVLLNMMRGAGWRGLAGIDSHRHPILSLRRSETRAVCTAFGVTPIVDVTNADPTIRRNRVRHELIPLLNDIAQRDVVDVLARMADVVRTDEEFVEDLAADVDVTDVKGLRSQADPVMRRALRSWLTPLLRDENGEQHPPSLETLQRVIQVVRGEIPRTDVAGGIRVARSSGKLYVESASSSPSSE